MIRVESAFVLAIFTLVIGVVVGMWVGYEEGFADGKQWQTDHRAADTFKPVTRACGWADAERRKPIRWCLRKEFL